MWMYNTVGKRKKIENIRKEKIIVICKEENQGRYYKDGKKWRNNTQVEYAIYYNIDSIKMSISVR